jgi:hypothetical protein
MILIRTNYKQPLADHMERKGPSRGGTHGHVFHSVQGSSRQSRSPLLYQRSVSVTRWSAEFLEASVDLDVALGGCVDPDRDAAANEERPLFAVDV